MARTYTWCKGFCTAVVVAASSVGVSATSAANETAPVAAGAWSIDSATVRVLDGRDGRVVELGEAQMSRPGEGGWTLVADRIVLTYDALGRLDSISAHDDVRVVGESGREFAYVIGQHAWLEPSGARGVVLGHDVAVVRDNWKIRASHLDIDFTASRLALRGVESGPVRARRDDN